VSDIPHDPKSLRIDPAAFSALNVPAKIRKRREQFIMLPMSWYEKLGKAPRVTGTTCLVALHLHHLHWKNRGKPFKLPNGTLRYDGVGRNAKWRALRELESRGLITIESRQRKSPIIRIQIDP
jgi:hypothetical protein